MPLFRCQNADCVERDAKGRLSFTFESAEPKCPKCGADRRSPETGYLVLPVPVVHLYVPDPKGPDRGHSTGSAGLTRMRVACGGSRKGGRITTIEFRQVNCPACKATDEWKQAQLAHANSPLVPSEHDYRVNITPQGITKCCGTGGARNVPDA